MLHIYIQGIEGLNLFGGVGGGGNLEILCLRMIKLTTFSSDDTVNKLGCMHGQQGAEEA